VNFDSSSTKHASGNFAGKLTSWMDYFYGMSSAPRSGCDTLQEKVNEVLAVSGVISREKNKEIFESAVRKLRIN